MIYVGKKIYIGKLICRTDTKLNPSRGFELNVE